MTEELNLSELFSNFVKFISRNRKLLLVFMGVGIISVVGYQKFKSPYYETKAICMSGISEYERQVQVEDLSQRTAIDLINHLQINIENGDYSALTTLLGVDANIAATIKKIEAEQLSQEDMNEKFYALNKFEISLTVRDNLKINDIQSGLIYYFKNNEFVKNYYESYLQSCDNIIEVIQDEMLLLANIRKEGAKNNLDISSVNVISDVEGNSVFSQTVALSQLREEIKTKQALLKPLVFVRNFANVNQKEDDILLSGILGALLSFIFGLFVALVKEVKVI
jgi:hypothetical protein|tara:strand:- start:170 stop:1009 length:840 start_codon:yes stop_codon:yes gene_type:complete